MKTKLSIAVPLDAIFRRTCDELSITYVCIQEGGTDNQYEITYTIENDLFFLGIHMGMTHTREIFTT
jgi:hypothetical protein